jgi:hypothetical protein
MIGRIQFYAFGAFGDPGIARRAIKPGQKRAGADRPCQGVFASAAANQKNMHCLKPDRVVEDDGSQESA